MNDRELAGIGMTSKRTRERLISRLLEHGIKDWTVLDVMRSTPRHIFLDEALSHRAYEDVALPIGYGQTISQPFIVARMTETLLAHAPRREGKPGRVLEIGTGCGYQSAILSPLVGELFTVERIRPLLEKARRNLSRLRLRNVRFRLDDGTMGWPEEAPFDAILVAAAPARVPEELLQQLADGGCLIIPVGAELHQELQLIRRDGDSFHTEVLADVRFVPLQSGKVQH